MRIIVYYCYGSSFRLVLRFSGYSIPDGQLSFSCLDTGTKEFITVWVSQVSSMGTKDVSSSVGSWILKSPPACTYVHSLLKYLSSTDCPRGWRWKSDSESTLIEPLPSTQEPVSSDCNSERVALWYRVLCILMHFESGKDLSVSIRWPLPASPLPSSCTLLALASHSAGTELSAAQTQVGSAGVRLRGAQCHLFMPSSEGRYWLGHTPDIRGQSGDSTSHCSGTDRGDWKMFPKEVEDSFGPDNMCTRMQTHTRAHTHPCLQFDPL